MKAAIRDRGVKLWSSLHPRSMPQSVRLRAASIEDDERTTAILQKLLSPRSTAVDIGASHGAVLKEIVRHAPEGRHFAFEAIPQLAKRLEERFPDVAIRCVVLSDSPGETEFHHVTDADGYSGIRRRHYDGLTPHVEILKLRRSTLDDELGGEQPVRFIKIDVEGAELEVLRGAGRTLDRWRPHVLFEHGRGGADFYGTTPTHIWELLAEKHHFAISTQAGWLAGEAPLTKEGLCNSYETGAIWNYVAHVPRG